MFTCDGVHLILDSLRRRMGEVKHGGGSDWQDYYRVYEPIIEKIKAVLDAAPPNNGFHLTAAPAASSARTG